MSDESGEVAFDSGEDRISAMPRGPESVFLHWELEGRRSTEALEGGPCEWVIRVLNLSDGSSVSMPVDRDAARCYVPVQSGCTYGFELAVRSAGRWRTICRTERVAVPAARPRAGAGGLAAGTPPRPGVAVRGTATAPGAQVPGLRIETTPLRLGSSPHSPPGPPSGP